MMTCLWHKAIHPSIGCMKLSKSAILLRHGSFRCEYPIIFLCLLVLFKYVHSPISVVKIPIIVRCWKYISVCLVWLLLGHIRFLPVQSVISGGSSLQWRYWKQSEGNPSVVDRGFLLMIQWKNWLVIEPSIPKTCLQYQVGKDCFKKKQLVI